MADSKEKLGKHLVSIGLADNAQQEKSNIVGTFTSVVRVITCNICCEAFAIFKRSSTFDAVSPYENLEQTVYCPFCGK